MVLWTNLWFPKHKIQEDNNGRGGNAERKKKKKAWMRQRWMAKTLTVLGPQKQIAKKMTQPWGKQKWCLQSGTEIAWVRIERGHSLNWGPSPSKLSSNLIQSPPFSGILRPEHHLSVLHRKKNTHISVELRLWNCLYLFGFASVESR